MALRIGRASWLTVLYAGAVLLISACARTPPPAPGAAGPTEAVQAFSAAIQRGDAAVAWSLLSAKTQAEADRLAGEARKSAGDAGPQTGRQMLFGSAVPGGKTTAKEVSSDGGAAEVIVSDAPGSEHRFRTVREGSGWKVELELGPR